MAPFCLMANEPVGRHYDVPVQLSVNDPIGHWEISQPEVFDINGDGRPDVAYSRVGGDVDAELPLEIWISNQSGTMDLATESLVLGGIPTVLRGYRQILPADFNGDGRLDLFLEASGPEWDCGNDYGDCWPGGQNSLLLSDNDGKLNNVTATHLPAFPDFSHGSALLDFDGDGDMDIFVNNTTNTEQLLMNPPFSYLLENDGSGSFTVAADFSQPEYWVEAPPLVGRNGVFPENVPYGNSVPWSVAVDANGDGHMDLQFGGGALTEEDNNEGNRRNLLMLNNGDGSFGYLPGDAFPMPSWSDIAQHEQSLVYDLNGDGLDDQLLRQVPLGGGTTWIQVLISNGDGTFRDETAARYPFQSVVGIADHQLHDLDGDGHMDLFNSINWGEVDIRINDGEGNFRPLPINWADVGFNWVVLDVDNDGGTDFLQPTWDGLFLHKMNLPYGAELDGTSEDDRLIGGALHNVYRGLEGNDVLDGGLGDDMLYGGPGDDRIDSGRGNDLLDGGPGNDELNDIEGDDTYILNAADLAGNDLVWDYAGYDSLVFADFGLERVSSVAQLEGAGLQINFTDGGSIVIFGHFAGTGQAIERLRIGDCRYDITQDDTFTSGAIESALGVCLLPISLSGSVVDKADIGKPVHPVRIWLWDTVAKEPVEGFAVENAPDGSYLMENIPEGSYKVFYDAFGAANGYTDMLYYNVNCELGCDFITDGDILDLSSGPYEANVQMERRPLLSGRVTNNFGLPLAGVDVELYNAQGVLVVTAEGTNAEGDWYQIVPGPGTYYARIVGKSIPGYRPEVWQNKPCEECDVTLIGTPIEVSGADVPGIDFHLSLAGAEKIFANGFDFAVEVPSMELQQPLFNYAPGSPLVLSALMSDGGMLLVLGEKTPDGLLDSITSFRVTPAGNPLASMEATFDEFGRPSSIESIFGTTTYSYDSGNVTVISTNAAGESESFVVPEPQQAAAVLSRPQAAATCDVSSLISQKLLKGEVVFACDNAYVEDGVVPNSLSMSLIGDVVDENDNFKRGTVEVPKLNIKTSLGIDQPEISQHGYEYEVNAILRKAPDYPEWEPCCQVNAEATARELENKKTLLEQIASGIGTLEKISNFTNCGFELASTGGTVAPTCVALVQSYFVDYLMDEAKKALASDENAAPACGRDDYDIWMKRNDPSGESPYEGVDIVFEKTGVRGSRAVYSKFSQNLLADDNGKLPTLKIGPVPADFEPRTGIESIRAYRSNGATIAQAGGSLDESAVVSVGETLDFRAFDQFFDRSGSGPFSNASHEANQHYNCADYSWTLRRNGNVVQTYTHGANDDRFRTQPLAEGDYQLSLSIDSTSKTYDDDFFRRQYMEGDTPAGSTISPAQTTLNFTVKPTYAVSVEKVSINTGLAAPGGLVTSTPAGINCGDTCSETFTDLVSLQLTAFDAEGWSFRYWTAPAECATEELRELSTCDVNLAETVSATAVFEPDPVTTTSIVNGEYTNVGDYFESCGPSFATAWVHHTGTYTGTMEDGGSIEWVIYCGSDGVIEETCATGSHSIPDNVSPANGSVSWRRAYCWGASHTQVWHGFRYVNPLGVKSNEVRVFVPQP
jgi:Ca2+-binding RTX toxin-like protein